MRSAVQVRKSKMLVCIWECKSTKGKCKLATENANLQKPKAIVQPSMQASKSEMQACARECRSAKAKSTRTVADANLQKWNPCVHWGMQTCKIQRPSASAPREPVKAKRRLTAGNRVCKGQMRSCRTQRWSAKAVCRSALRDTGLQKRTAASDLGHPAGKTDR